MDDRVIPRQQPAVDHVVAGEVAGRLETVDRGVHREEIVEVPLTGKIISVNVKVGDEVKEGDTLCLLESMKMENPILAPVNGTVAQVDIEVDQVVKPGGVIAIIDY